MKKNDKIISDEFFNVPKWYPVAGDQIIKEIHSTHSTVVPLNNSRHRHLNRLPLHPVEAAAGRNRVHPVLVGSHVNCLVIFPGNKDLILIEDSLEGSPRHCLLLQLLLLHYGHPIQSVLPHSA